jgi:hypothetical protein
MVVAKWHVRRTSGAPKALAVALSFCCLLSGALNELKELLGDAVTLVIETIEKHINCW